MWKCPNCQRPFNKAGQWHICGEKTIDEIFANADDNVVLAFDDLLLATADWEPNLITPARKAIMFTNKRAWLVVRPLRKVLDVSFFSEKALHSPHLHKSGPDGMRKSKFRHTIRLSGPDELGPEQVDLLRLGYAYGMR